MHVGYYNYIPSQEKCFVPIHPTELLLALLGQVSSLYYQVIFHSAYHGMQVQLRTLHRMMPTRCWLRLLCVKLVRCEVLSDLEGLTTFFLPSILLRLQIGENCQC